MADVDTATPEEDKKPLPSYADVMGLRDGDIIGPVFQYLELQKEIDQREYDQKQLKSEIDRILLRAGSDGAMVEGARVQRFAGKKPAKKLDTAKLIQQGVTPEQIAAATTLGKPGEPGIRITGPKQ